MSANSNNVNIVTGLGVFALIIIATFVGTMWCLA